MLQVSSLVRRQPLGIVSSERGPNARKTDWQPALVFERRAVKNRDGLKRSRHSETTKYLKNMVNMEIIELAFN